MHAELATLTRPSQASTGATGGRMGRVIRLVDSREPLDLEALLHWAIARELADLALAGDDVSGWLAPARSGDGCAELLRRFEVGDVSVGGGYGAAGASPSHQDALLIWAIARQELEGEREALQLVRACARSGERPDWGQDLPVVQLRPEWVVKGRQLKARERVVRGGARYCPIRLQDNAEALRLRRAAYRAWWQAMARLAGVMAAAPLITRRCSGFQAPARPWEQLAA